MRPVMTPANTPAASAVNSLRVKALLDEVPKTYIASQVGLSRESVRKHLKSDDMYLSEFINIALAINADPVRILAEAIKSTEKEKASAATDAQ